MNPIAVMGAAIFLLIIIRLVNKRTRDGICKNGAPKDEELFGLATLIIIYNCLLAAYENRLGWHQLAVTVYFMVPTFVAVKFKPRGKRWDSFVNLLLIGWMWIPNDFGLNFIFQSWGGGMFGYALTALTGMAYIMLLFTGWRKLDLKLDWSFAKKDLLWIFGLYLLLALLIIPPALKVGFIHVGLVKTPAKAALSVFIWFAPALCEELIFRAVIQQTLVKWLRPFFGILLASLVFGISHIDNKAGNYSYPNFWYVLFSYLAAQFGYGLIYHKTKKLQCSTTLHFFVDLTWVLFFRGGK